MVLSCQRVYAAAEYGLGRLLQTCQALSPSRVIVDQRPNSTRSQKTHTNTIQNKQALNYAINSNNMENKSSGKSGEVSKNESTAKKQVSNYQPGNTANNSKKAAGQAVDVSNTLNFNFALLIARRYSLYPISSSTLSLETNMKRYFEYLKSENLSDHACLEHYLERFGEFIN